MSKINYEVKSGERTVATFDNEYNAVSFLWHLRGEHIAFLMSHFVLLEEECIKKASKFYTIKDSVINEQPELPW